MSNKFQCKDINECNQSPPVCNPNTSKCTNTKGSYQCDCNTGYENEDVNDKRSECLDIDECDRGISKCEIEKDYSVLKIGKKNGWEGYGIVRVGNCMNTAGSYFCVCNEGFLQKGDFKCKDIDECSKGEHQCNCDEKFGCKADKSYKCVEKNQVVKIVNFTVVII